MKAEELRIGNLVNYQKYKSIFQGKITCISEDRIVFDGYAVVKCNSGNLIPISITEDWLLKLGFKEYSLNWWSLPEGNNYKSHHLMKMQNAWTWFIDFSDDDDNPNCHIVKGFTFVHELQNLCFALTGEELTTV